MANLNLSQFTEKTFVADADWTFVWDTAGAISKKVSRNSLLNSGTLTADAPVTISQTWNGTGSTVFKALVVNATTPGTTSSASSLLLDLQVGGVSQFSVQKNGSINANSTFNLNGTLIQSTGNVIPANALVLNYANQDVVLLRDASNTLALRNGAAAQKFRVYNTYTDASNFERAVFEYGSNQINFGSDVSGSGVHRKLNILGAGIDFYTAGVGIRWSITTAGHFIANNDNQFDIGASAANRPRNVYVAGTVQIGTSVVVDSIFGNRGGSVFYGGVDGNMRLTNNAGTDFNRLQLGGTADTAPAIARDGAGIKFTGAAAGLTSHIKVPAVAVASLPPAATAGVGARAFVNDATSPVFGSAVTGGGAVAVPVYSTGSAWNVG